MSPTPYSCQDIILSRNVEGELSKSEARTPLVRRNGPVGAMYPKGEVMPASEHSGWRRSTLARFPSPEELPGLVLHCAHFFLSTTIPE